MKRINLDQNRWPTVVTGQWPIYSHWWLHTCELHTEVVLIQNGVVSCLQSLSTHIYRRLLSKYNFSSCVWEWCVGGVCAAAWVDALHYENWKRKRSGANVLALNQYLNLTVDKAKSMEENFNENFCCLCLHFDSCLPLWKWSEEDGVKKKKEKTKTCFDISVKRKGMKAHYRVVSKRWRLCGRGRERQRGRGSLGSCFHGCACQH